ncbi:TetR/AcrR family transcriptional regulator [Streptomyces sp. NPDC004610]|uniref:TetR/AcrR family transcriptional regulator n=1 Tax=unclassified Streptomyces TaxID=2593676 RepID=UPI0033A2E1A4
MATTPTRLSKQARREQLLDTAAALVRAQGTDGLTLVTLAEAAGVSRPIVYDHFGTRPGLLLALYRRLDERHRTATAQALRDTAPTEDAVARVISTAYFGCARDMPEVTAVSAALKGNPEMETTRSELTDGYTALMADALAPYSGLSRAALRLRCAALLGAAEALAGELTRGRATEAAAIEVLTGLILNGPGPPTGLRA